MRYLWVNVCSWNWKRLWKYVGIFTVNTLICYGYSSMAVIDQSQTTYFWAITWIAVNSPWSMFVTGVQDKIFCNIFSLAWQSWMRQENKIYGFYDECKRRHNITLWKIFTNCFNCLLVLTIINEKIVCFRKDLIVLYFGGSCRSYYSY